MLNNRHCQVGKNLPVLWPEDTFRGGVINDRFIESESKNEFLETFGLLAYECEKDEFLLVDVDALLGVRLDRIVSIMAINVFGGASPRAEFKAPG